MIKKSASLIFVLLMIFVMSSVAYAYTAGTYTAQAKGNNADVPVKVQVTFDESK